MWLPDRIRVKYWGGGGGWLGVCSLYCTVLFCSGGIQEDYRHWNETRYTRKKKRCTVAEAPYSVILLLPGTKRQTEGLTLWSICWCQSTFNNRKWDSVVYTVLIALLLHLKLELHVREDWIKNDRGKKIWDSCPYCPLNPPLNPPHCLLRGWSQKQISLWQTRSTTILCLSV